ncbi:MAG: hemin uptake protein HemP, partial [Planctomycetota bacterium]
PQCHHTTEESMSAAPEEAHHAGQPPHCWSSAQLLGRRDEIVIHHAGTVYRLRRTRQDKLILTK